MGVSAHTSCLFFFFSLMCENLYNPKDCTVSSHFICLMKMANQESYDGGKKAHLPLLLPPSQIEYNNKFAHFTPPLSRFMLHFHTPPQLSFSLTHPQTHAHPRTRTYQYTELTTSPFSHMNSCLRWKMVDPPHSFCSTVVISCRRIVEYSVHSLRRNSFLAFFITFSRSRLTWKRKRGGGERGKKGERERERREARK